MSKEDVDEEVSAGTSIGNASVEFTPTAMFAKKLKAVDVYDKRRKKTEAPHILKRFRKYFGES